MYNKLSFWVAATLLLCCGCKKVDNSTETPSAILQAQAFFNQTIAGSVKSINPDNYRANQHRTVDWGKATVQQLPTGDVVVAPIRFTNTLLVATKTSPERAFNLNDLTYLVVSVDSDRLKRAYTVTLIPDTMNRPESPSGYYFVEDWQGNSLLSPVHRVKNGNVPSASLSRSTNAKEADYVYNITTCTEVDGYNYSPDDPDGGYSWSETTCTSFSLVADGSDDGSTIPDLPGTGSVTSVVIAVAPPSNPIANIVDYLSCFSNASYPDHTYSVQVCVDQPSPGTRQAWGFTSGGPAGSSAAGNIVNTGHVFLIFSENDQGTVIFCGLGT